MKKILIAVNDDDISRELVELGSALGRQPRAELYLVYVYEVPLSLPIDTDVPGELDKGDRILEKAAEVADESRVDVKTDIIQARTAGAGLVTEACNLKVDLIILGMREHPGYGETIKSQTVEYVLKKAPCKVLVYRSNKKVTDEK